MVKENGVMRQQQGSDEAYICGVCPDEISATVPDIVFIAAGGWQSWDMGAYWEYRCPQHKLTLEQVRSIVGDRFL